MKKIFIIFTIVVTASFYSCKEDVDVDTLLNFPPAIASLQPRANANVVTGNFDIKVVALDGTKSPLASGKVTLKDAEGNVLYEMNEELTGLKDSIVVSGSAFDAASLGEGAYTLEVDLRDTHDQQTLSVTTFNIVTTPYPSNQKTMFIAGAFNGWGADPLELIANNTWQIKNIDLQGGEWKLKNTVDWSDEDWSDSDCNGVMEISTGGGPNTNCGYTGLVNITFDDETLKYTVSPAVEYNNNITALYLLGTMNNFEGSEYRFANTADHTWELSEVLLNANSQFRFSEGPFSEPVSFGDVEGDGIAEQYSPNIRMSEETENAYYKITFNDASNAYQIEFVRYPYPETLYLVGGSTVAGWTPENAVPFVSTGDGTFEIYSYIVPAGDGFKLLPTQTWDGDWGKGEEGELIQEGESNLTVAEEGFYLIRANFIDRIYEILPIHWSIIGNATPGGWENDTDMSFVGGLGDYTWRVTADLVPGEFKFRANQAWDISLGPDGEGQGLWYVQNNLVVAQAGTYIIELVLDPSSGGYSYTIEED